MNKELLIREMQKEYDILNRSNDINVKISASILFKYLDALKRGFYD